MRVFESGTQTKPLSGGGDAEGAGEGDKATDQLSGFLLNMRDSEYYLNKTKVFSADLWKFDFDF